MIIDPRSVVMSRAAIDVTEEAIRRINANIGDGTGEAMPQDLSPDSPARPATPDAPATPQD